VKLLHVRSLAATVEAVDEELFFGRKIAKADKAEVAKWIAGRQGLPGSYAGMFAPTKQDAGQGMRVFTGQKIPPSAALRHILGEEACRALTLLNVPNAAVREALRRATEGMVARMPKPGAGDNGMYCCGRCSCAYWRNLAVGGLRDGERHLAAAMKTLKAHRSDDGKWRRFPFYYTLLALSEIEARGAVGEMRYAAPLLEALLKRKPRRDKYAARRRSVAERVLARC
jgi:hypothetical protein